MAQPSPEIRQRLAQLKAEAMIRAERDIQRQKAVLGGEKVSGQPVRLPTDKKAKGGLAEFLKDSHVKHRLYHGTNADIKEFDPKKIGQKDAGWYGKGFYFTSNPETASAYASFWGGPDEQEGGHPNVIPVHISLKNPYYWPENKGMLANPKEIEKLTRQLKAMGHDGIIVNSNGRDEYIAFHPHQIKSAIGNRGTYDPNDPDITKAKGGAVEDDYRSEHTAPSPDFGAPMHDVTRDMYPKDFYGPNGFQYYADFGEQKDRDAYNKVTRVKGKPDEMVYIHRAIPTKVYNEALKKDSPLKHMIRPGDWVAIHKDYAKEHGESVLLGDYKIASMRVPAKHVWTNGDSIHEWGYHPVEEKSKGGSMSAEEAFGFSEDKKPEPPKRKAIDVANQAIDTVMPLRRMGRIGVDALIRAIQSRTQASPSAYADVASHTSEGAEAWRQTVQDAMRRGLGMSPIQRTFDVERILGPLEEGSLPRPSIDPSSNGFAHGGQPSMDVMRLAIGGQGPRNFLKGSVEKVIEPLKRYDLPDLFPELGEPPPNSDANKAVNKWIESNLANYIRKQMGHPNDPLRKLAEEGVLHIDPDQLGVDEETAEQRRQMLNGQKMAKGPLAQAWENAVDTRFEPNTVEDVRNMPDIYKGMYEPWMDKADPKTNLYELYGANELGFDHIVDILKQDLAEGRIRPEQLNKVSIEQAVRRVHEYDQAQKKKMAETALKATEGMPVHKDYGDGFKWIELTMPNKPLPEGYTLGGGNDKFVFDPSGKDVPHPNYQALEDALKYEGDTMGHCVGGYTPDVASGKSRIFSLRDEKNEPHVTVEVKPEKNPYIGNSGNITDEGLQKIRRMFPDSNFDLEYGEWFKKNGGHSMHFAKEYAPWIKENHPEIYEATIGAPLEHKIKQIKGKGNAKPVKNYMPFVHDFVRSSNMEVIGDLNHTDLRKVGNKYLTDDELDALSRQHLGTVIANPARYYSDMKRKDPSTISEADQNYINALENFQYPPHMADGGEVDAEAVFMAKGGKVSSEPKKTVKAYKLFRVDERHPGKLFPLFVNANQPVEMNKWVDAEVGPQTDKGKVKSKLGPLAYRPGWHSGDLPVATHIGAGGAPPTHRPKNHAWAEVEVPDDVDWQTEANKRGTNAQGKLVPVKAHITDQIPKGGHYRYKTNPNMTGNWLISGSMKVNKVLSQAEVDRINKKAGVSDLPRKEPFNKKQFGFKHGGEVDAQSFFFPENKE